MGHPSLPGELGEGMRCPQAWLRGPQPCSGPAPCTGTFSQPHALGALFGPLVALGSGHH